MNDYLSTVIIAPMTTKAKTAEFRIPITHDKKQGLILLDQIRTIDKTRLLKKIGSSSPKTLQASLRVLQEAFAI
jgi:mRNA interferase MazF